MRFETLSYGDHALQTITVATPDPPANTPTPLSNYWIVLIHGGAWRDPTQTASNYLTPLTTHLPPTTRSRITSLASVSYRLSAHPSHPQDPQSTPSQDLRTASHPDHIHDIQNALAYLQDRYAFGDRYVLVGHSCGATLAFQSVMGRFGSAGSCDGGGRVTPPQAILGMAGIYDLRLLRDTHADISAYQEFIEGAFGADERRWDAASPAVVRGGEGVEEGWKGGRLAVLAQSLQDGLVDLRQREVMLEALQLWKEKATGRKVEVLDISGNHDEAWETGVELARAIAFTLEKLSAMYGA